jgi:glucose 1-dehydrogenase
LELAPTRINVNAIAAGLIRTPMTDYVTGQSFTIDAGLEMNWGQGA